MEKQSYKFELPPLPYQYDALQPYIDQKTMELHHDRHFKTYIDNLNAALEKYPQYQSWSLKQLIYYGDELPPEIRTQVKNSAGGVYNHDLYFKSMIHPHFEQPRDALLQAINRDFGSFEKFKEKFSQSAAKLFGSGYTWLVSNKMGKLTIVNTANQDTPLIYGFCPLMLIDVWEHAYYLKHYNKRADYIADWLNVVHWHGAEQRYNKCVKKPERVYNY